MLALPSSVALPEPANPLLVGVPLFAETPVPTALEGLPDGAPIAPVPGGAIRGEPYAA